MSLNTFVSYSISRGGREVQAHPKSILRAGRRRGHRRSVSFLSCKTSRKTSSPYAKLPLVIPSPHIAHLLLLIRPLLLLRLRRGRGLRLSGLILLLLVLVLGRSSRNRLRLNRRQASKRMVTALRRDGRRRVWQQGRFGTGAVGGLWAKDVGLSAVGGRDGRGSVGCYAGREGRGRRFDGGRKGGRRAGGRGSCSGCGALGALGEQSLHLRRE